MKDDGWYKVASLLNDIDNGEDVDDEVVRKAFPPLIDDGKLINPGGLNKEWQAKLDAIRAKKDKEKKDKDLKATPPEKK